MSAGAGTDGSDLLFIVGCPRSGTTWLQLLLAQHPAVATINETHLFEHFVGPALDRWDELAEGPRELGIASVMERGEFVERQRAFAREVYDRVAGPGTRLVVDKTPDHALWLDAVSTCFPGARLLHLVRDPRDVAASLLAAGSSWGRGWAPGTAFEAAWTWCEHVRAARGAETETSAAAYRELRYEDLYERPERELTELLDWLSLEVPPDFVAEAVRETSVDRMRSGETDAPWDLDAEPEGFVRKGGTGNWRDELSRSQAAVVEYVCSDLMPAFGYRPRRSRTVPPPGFYLPWLRDQIRGRL